MSNFIPQEQYNFILQHMPIACVDVCIISDKGILLVKRNTEPCNGMYWIPGGRVFKGEMLKDCAKRKCIEEVGLNCIIGPIVHTEETVFDTGPNGIPVHSINCAFICFPSNFNVKLDKYSSDYIWLPHITADLHPYVKKCLIGCGLN